MGPRLMGRYLLYWMVFRNAQTLSFYINITEVIKTSTLTVYLGVHLLQAVIFLKICHSQELIHTRKKRTAFWPKQYHSIPTNVTVF